MRLIWLESVTPCAPGNLLGQFNNPTKPTPDGDCPLGYKRTVIELKLPSIFSSVLPVVEKVESVF